MKKLLLFLITVYVVLPQLVCAQVITTLAGNGLPGYSGDGTAAISCEFNNPYAIAVDNNGNVYVADRHNNCIRKINASGIITTIAGNGTAAYSGDNSPATAAELSSPLGITLDALGNVYISDAGNNRVRKIDNAGIITTIAGNGAGGYNGDNMAATDAELSGPRELAFDSYGNLYIADPGNNRIRKINAIGILTTAAGTGTPGFSGDGGQATLAELKTPYAIACDANGNLYIGDVDNERIRQVNTSGVITTIAGNGSAAYGGDFGPATDCTLNEPIGLAVDKNGQVYIADGWNGRIRQINGSGIITTVAGNGTLGYSGDGNPANLAELNDPYGIAVDTNGNIYIADYANNRIRYMTRPTSVPPVPVAQSSINIFPNPCNNACTIYVPASIKEPMQILITSPIGRVLKQITTTTNQYTNITMDEPGGMYCITVITATQVWNRKLIINH